MRRPTIFIADDDDISLTVLSNYLAPAAQIITANNGIDAIEIIKSALPDIIILDIVMPGLNGLDVCRNIKCMSNFSLIPVIFISSIEDLAGKIDGFSAGGVDYITKPFLCEEIKLRINTHLDLYLLRKDLEKRVAERTLELTKSLSKLHEAQKRIQRAEKLASLGTLASGISHEINTPIQFIGDNLTFLQSAIVEFKTIIGGYRQCTFTHQENDNGLNVENLAHEMAQAVNESLDGVSRVRDIVQAVKMFAHPGIGTMVPQAPARLVETAISVSRNSWRQVADLSVQVDPDLPTLPCHGSDIDQVLLVLILNAVDAIEHKVTGGRGHIKVVARQVGFDIEFSVTDNGCGIPENIRPMIWDLFFTTKEPGKGTGQGLAICHNIVVVKHGGVIDCESVSGQGSRFFFTLPISGRIV